MGRGIDLVVVQVLLDKTRPVLGHWIVLSIIALIRVTLQTDLTRASYGCHFDVFPLQSDNGVCFIFVF